jgi:hypothetical protein
MSPGPASFRKLVEGASATAAGWPGKQGREYH